MWRLDGAGGDGLMPRGIHIGWHVDAMWNIA